MLHIDLERIARDPLMREMSLTFLAGGFFGTGRLFFAEYSVAHEILLRGFIGLTIIATCVAIYLVVSNTKLTHK